MTSLITIFVDNDSWILPYAKRLSDELRINGYEVLLSRTAEDIKEGWICFLLGCTNLISLNNLKKNRHNLVVHESALPSGRGFAPMTWQILEGKRDIPICLLEAGEEADRGDIWLSDVISLSGTELCREWRHLQGLKTIELCSRFVNEYKSLMPIAQKGEGSWYDRRRPADSELDINKSIKEQFCLLRVVDNDRYPAFFEVNGQRYELKIHKADY